jgi:dTDP-4-amino-4,6-dideoxygalactose transaminase
MRSGNIKQGAKVEELEEMFADLVGSKYAIAVSSCTNALFLCLQYYQPKEVMCPTITFASVPSTILQAGARLVFTDYVYVGEPYPLKMDKGIIWDSAHAIGDADAAGNDPVCYSFYPTKIVSGAEGGMIATNNSRLATWARKARDHGKSGGNWKYKIEFPGWHMRMNEVQAAIAIEQLKKLPDLNARRRDIVDNYNSQLKGHMDNNPPLHLYILQVKKRNQFIKYMEENGVQVSAHYATPLHKQPAFKDEYKNQRAKFRSSEKYARGCTSLPLYPDLSDKEVNYICKLVKLWQQTIKKN